MKLLITTVTLFLFIGCSEKKSEVKYLTVDTLQPKIIHDTIYSIPDLPVYDSNGNVFYYNADSISKNKKYSRKILYGTAGIKK